MNLLILGASARAAAWSALRAGFVPVAADLFADADLAQTCHAQRVDPSSYPEGLAAHAATVEPMAWLPTGALENRPDLVDRISRRHRLLGNPGPVLRAVRDPARLAEALRARGRDAPPVRLDPAGVPTDGSWLRKPLASAAGHSIRPWRGGELAPGSVLQRRVAGVPLAAVFVGQGRLAGISRQFLDGRSSDGRFRYRGSLAPAVVPDPLAAEIARIGPALAEAFGLVGLFGVDLIADAAGRAWVIEVNPRYSASVEAVEWATGRSLLLDHVRACGLDATDAARPHPAAPDRFVAKAILRARFAATWPEGDLGPFDPARFPTVADVPHPGTRFDPGDPVVTVFASGPTPAACRRALARGIAHERRRLVPIEPTTRVK